MKTLNYDSAFPSTPIYDGIHRLSEHGLTKREYFAGLAMQGLAADNMLNIEYTVRIAVELADALIEELNKTKE